MLLTEAIESSQLTKSDLQKLVDLSRGKVPIWDKKALQRCAHLVTPTGNFLSFAGKRKVERISAVMDELRAGISLHIERDDRSSDLLDDGWVTTQYGAGECWVSESAVFAGKVPNTFEAIVVNPDDSAFVRLKDELQPVLDSKILTKVEPIAIQRNTIEGLEVAVLRGVVDKSILIRIQTKYYDFITTYWDRITWWLHVEDAEGGDILNNRPQEYVVIKAHGNLNDPSNNRDAENHLQGDIVGIVRPVYTEEWAIPEAFPGIGMASGDGVTDSDTIDAGGGELWQKQERKSDDKEAQKPEPTKPQAQQFKRKPGRPKGSRSRKRKNKTNGLQAPNILPDSRV